jgi:glycosyltransferase involved in cell wall biosynthesis
VTPRFSVILPAYNAEPFVEEAVRSILDQEFGDLELIAINDGSKDRTSAVLHSIDDPRMTVIDQENQGLSATRNRGRSVARGEFLANLDADDRWRPDYLLRSTQIFDSERDVGVVFSNFVRFAGAEFLPGTQFDSYVGIDEIPVRPSREGSGFVVESDPFEAFVVMSELPAYSSALTYRARVAADLPYIDQQFDSEGVFVFLEDIPFAARLFARTGVAYIRDPLMEMRRHETNQTRHWTRLDVAKRNSLLRVREEPLTDRQKAALDARLGRAYALAARQRARERRLAQAVMDYGRTAAMGRLGAAIYGLARLPFDAIQGPRER